MFSPSALASSISPPIGDLSFSGWFPWALSCLCSGLASAPRTAQALKALWSWLLPCLCLPQLCLIQGVSTPRHSDLGVCSAGPCSRTHRHGRCSVGPIPMGFVTLCVRNLNMLETLFRVCISYVIYISLFHLAYTVTHGQIVGIFSLLPLHSMSMHVCVCSLLKKHFKSPPFSLSL